MDKSNNTTDSANAKSYMLIYEKTELDSVYKVKQFSMNNKILVAGGFKNKELNVLHGDFETYVLRDSTIKHNESSDKKVGAKEINHFLEKKGLYLDGKKIGIWTTYYANGEVSMRETFKDDLLHGKYVKYLETGKAYLEGNYVDNLKDGDWLMYGGSSVDTYKMGKLLRHKENRDKEAEKKEKATQKYDVAPMPPVNFSKDLYEFIESIDDRQVEGSTAEVLFFIDEKGKIFDPKVTGITDSSLAKKIGEYFVNSSKWFPATQGKDKIPIKSRHTYILKF